MNLELGLNQFLSLCTTWSYYNSPLPHARIGVRVRVGDSRPCPTKPNQARPTMTNP